MLVTAVGTDNSIHSAFRVAEAQWEVSGWHVQLLAFIREQTDSKGETDEVVNCNLISRASIAITSSSVLDKSAIILKNSCPVKQLL